MKNRSYFDITVAPVLLRQHLVATFINVKYTH